MISGEFLTSYLSSIEEAIELFVEAGIERK